MNDLEMLAQSIEEIDSVCLPISMVGEINKLLAANNRLKILYNSLLSGPEKQPPEPEACPAEEVPDIPDDPDDDDNTEYT